MIVQTPDASTEQKAAGSESGDGYNHDVMLSAEFLASHDSIKLALDQPEVRRGLLRYDAVCRKAKLRWMATGVVSLLLAGSALLGVVAELSWPALGGSLARSSVFLIEVTAFLALVVCIVSWAAKLRHRFLNACYARERYRQLFFQLFLDGPLVEALLAGDKTAKEKVAKVVNELEEQLRNPTGARRLFVGSVPRVRSLLFKPKPYADAKIAKSVYKALSSIRVTHQLQYLQRRLDDAADDRVMSLKEHYHWSESFAVMCFVGALCLPIAQLAMLVGGGPHADYSNAHTIMSAVALALVSLSAVIRAYQKGMSVPEVLESYEEYAIHVESIRDQFHAEQTTDALRHALLQELELEAERELRRFLSIRGKATFVI